MLLAVAPSYAAAQLSASVDGGWASVRYDEYLRTSVLTVTPSLRMDYPLSMIAARGTLSLFESGSRSLDLSIGANTFTRARGIWRAELSGTGGGTIYNGFGTGHLSGGLRLHAISPRRGAWFGGSGGYVDDGIAPSSVARYGTGAWARLGGLVLNASATHLHALDVDVNDIEGGLRFSRGAANLSATTGVRLGASELIGAKSWGELSAVLWFGKHLALTAAHGRYLSEPGRGTPGANYTSVSMRIATRAAVQEVAAERNPRYEAPAIARPIVGSFQVKRVADSTYLIGIRAAGARRVEIAGDFTDWQPAELQRKSNSDNFTIKLHLPLGAHKFNVRVDAGEWGVPPGVPLLRDDLAGVVALLIIQQSLSLRP